MKVCGIFGKLKLVFDGPCTAPYCVVDPGSATDFSGCRQGTVQYSTVHGNRQRSMALRSGREASSGYIVYPYLNRLF